MAETMVCFSSPVQRRASGSSSLEAPLLLALLLLAGRVKLVMIVSCDAHLFDDRLLLALDANFFTEDPGLFPLAHVLVLVGIIGVELLDIQVFDIGDSIGDAPGHVAVMPDDDAGRAGEARANDIDISG